MAVAAGAAAPMGFELNFRREQVELEGHCKAPGETHRQKAGRTKSLNQTKRPRPIKNNRQLHHGTRAGANESNLGLIFVGRPMTYEVSHAERPPRQWLRSNADVTTDVEPRGARLAFHARSV
jgi:hypothetical protein